MLGSAPSRPDMGKEDSPLNTPAPIQTTQELPGAGAGARHTNPTFPSLYYNLKVNSRFFHIYRRHIFLSILPLPSKDLLYPRGYKKYVFGKEGPKVQGRGLLVLN